VRTVLHDQQARPDQGKISQLKLGDQLVKVFRKRVVVVTYGLLARL
jgi:hypothetical protein